MNKQEAFDKMVELTIAIDGLAFELPDGQYTSEAIEALEAEYNELMVAHGIIDSAVYDYCLDEDLLLMR